MVCGCQNLLTIITGKDPDGYLESDTALTSKIPNVSGYTASFTALLIQRNDA